MQATRETDTRTRATFSVLIVFIAFAWIAVAYALGTKSERMLFHPLVPILLIVLLMGVRNEDSVRRVVIIAILFIVFWLLVRLQSVFMPFIIGFALAYVVNVALAGIQSIPIPLPKGQKLRLPRSAAVVIILALMIGVIAFFALEIVPQLIRQAVDMKDGVISFYNRAKDYTVKLAEGWERREYPLKDRLPISWQAAIEGYIEGLVAYLQEGLPSYARRASELLAAAFGRLSSGLLGTLGQISSAFFIFIVFVYAVGSFRSHMERLKNLIPENHRESVVRYMTEIDLHMRGFLKGQLTVIVILSIVSAIVYSILRVPFALMVGMLAGLCNAIPSVGPIIGGGIAVLACLVGLVTGSTGWNWFLIQLLLVIGAAFGIQILDNSLISPRIMSQAVEVHPLVVVFAVLLSASIIGVWGAVLAIPGIVICKAIIKVSCQIRIEREAQEMSLDNQIKE